MKNSIFLFLICLLISTFFFMGFQCGTAEMTSAKLYIQRSEWDNAKVQLQKELEKHPENAEAWFLLGRIHFEQKNYSEMLKAIIPVRLSAKSKVLQAAMGELSAPLTYAERQALKSEALAEAEVGQLIAQLLPGKVPEKAYDWQHPYTFCWIQALPDLGGIRPYNAGAIKSIKATYEY